MASLLKNAKTGIWYGRHFFTDVKTGKRKEKRKSLETQDKATARRRLMKWEAQVEARKWGEREGVTFEEARANGYKRDRAAPSEARRQGRI